MRRPASISIVAISERAAQLDLRESEAVAQAIRCPRESFEFLATVKIEQIELSRTCGKIGEFHSHQTQHRRAVPRVRKQIANSLQKLTIQVARFPERTASRNRPKIRITNCQSDGTRMKSRIAQTFRRLLAEVA